MPFNPQQHLITLPRKVKEKDGRYTTVYDEYLEVKWRLVMFREKYPHGVITTEEVCVDLERGYARFRAVVEDGEGGKATGYGTETKADFSDFVERSETRALGRALACLGYGTAFVGQDLTEGEHIVDAPVTTPNGQARETLSQPVDQGFDGQASPEAKISRDQARELKKRAQSAFGFTAGEAQLREDLGLEEGKALTLR